MFLLLLCNDTSIEKVPTPTVYSRLGLYVVWCVVIMDELCLAIVKKETYRELTLKVEELYFFILFIYSFKKTKQRYFHSARESLIFWSNSRKVISPSKFDAMKHNSHPLDRKNLKVVLQLQLPTRERPRWISLRQISKSWVHEKNWHRMRCSLGWNLFGVRI